jgi:peptide subunit release factor 1 (eRF1)
VFAEVDLRKLAEMSAPERAFLSVYLSGPRSAKELPKTLKRMARALEDSPGSDERDHFEHNVAAVVDHLDKKPLKKGGMALFSCWALDYMLAVPLSVPVKDLVRFDSSPFIRPLAEIQDEYENVAVVVADNKRARIFLVSSAVPGPEETVKGNVKNHVKKGGWSQQRYERRRDKELRNYARGIVSELEELAREEDFRHIVMVGGKEILKAVEDNLPQRSRAMVEAKALDLRKGDDAIDEDIMEVFAERERATELDLWEKIRDEYFRGGLGAVGLDEVLPAAKEGRVEAVIVNRGFAPKGRRCRDCENLEVGELGEAGGCGACGSKSVFEVDVVNEIVEMLKATGAEVDFADTIPALAEAGEIAALLRYRR